MTLHDKIVPVHVGDRSRSRGTRSRIYFKPEPANTIYLTIHIQPSELLRQAETSILYLLLDRSLETNVWSSDKITETTFREAPTLGDFLRRKSHSNIEEFLWNERVERTPGYLSWHDYSGWRKTDDGKARYREVFSQWPVDLTRLTGLGVLR
ncbi:MAG TPA: hypothetical protein VJG90_04345 [Candidatus Nanoarchaeia archaeon]|nr:hypothetical protein [Candidatus Nanoarchaeia archaeon]